uniref:Uncharacterized protein n=1 Tax=Salix viminalis TaxID=40686 RepID=A0A6N2KHZ6_SALVM
MALLYLLCCPYLLHLHCHQCLQLQAWACHYPHPLYLHLLHGPPPKDQVSSHTPLPPPPPLQQSARPPPPPGTNESGRETNISALLDESSSKDNVQVPASLPPPPPIAMQLKSANNLSEVNSSEADANTAATMDNPKMVPPPPPPRQQPLALGQALIPTLQADVLPPGISRFPPPPPNAQPPLSSPGIPGQVAPPGVMLPLIPRPPYGPPPGPPPMMRPPLPPGPPPFLQEDAANRPYVLQKPSYIKSAASTVVKRPLAQHTPELTAMVPASVRVRREAAIPKPKPKAVTSTTAVATRPAAPTTVKPDSTYSSAAPKSKSIDDSYTAFLEDMKALGNKRVQAAVVDMGLEHKYLVLPLALDVGEHVAARTIKQEEEHGHKVHCSRERSRAAWQAIEEVSDFE